VLFYENKLQYLLPVQDPAGLAEFEAAAIPRKISGRRQRLCRYPHAHGCGGAPAVITLVAYGYMAELARQAALQLAYESEIFTELVIPTQLAPFSWRLCLESARRTGRCCSHRKRQPQAWVGARKSWRRSAETMDPSLRAARRVAAIELPIRLPGSLEAKALPGVEAGCANRPKNGITAACLLCLPL